MESAMKPHWQNIEPSPYALLLEKDEWRNKRNHIVNRDGNKCQKCNNESYINNSELDLYMSFQTTISAKKGNFIQLQDKDERFVRKIDCTSEKFKSTFQKEMNFCFINSSKYLIAVFQLDNTNKKNSPTPTTSSGPK